jgi:hypothetical protein
MTMVVAVGLQQVERAAHRLLVHRVEMRGRLVEDQDRRVLQEGARDRDALALAAAQTGAALADRRVEAVGQGWRRARSARRADRRLQLLPPRRRGGRSGCWRAACR